MPATTLKQLMRRVIWRIQDDRIFARAAQLSYYFLLALFPLLLFVISVLGYFAHAGSELRSNLIRYLVAFMPPSAASLIYTTLDEISASAGGGKLYLGLLAALWAASNGMGAISDTLNRAYNVTETRPWWRVRLVSIFLTVGVSILFVLAVAVILYGGSIGDALASMVGFGQLFTKIWRILQWPIAVFFVLVIFNLIYNFAPDIRSTQRKIFTPGAFVGVGLWLLVSFGFRLYLQYFNTYTLTYGSLGAVIILMLWFYFTGVAILIGGEINCEKDPLCERDFAERLGTGV